MPESVQLVVPDFAHPIDKLPNGKQFESVDLLMWAKNQDILPSDVHQGEMLGEISVSLLGKIARIGWMQTDPGFGYRILNPYHITQNERLTILEGDVSVKIYKQSGRIIYPHSKIQSYNFHYPDKVTFSNPSGPEGKCWYLFTPFLNKASGPLDS